VVIPPEVRAEIAAHAREEQPNEACGLVLIDGDRAVEYVRGRNATPSPYRFELFIDPVAWADIGDRELEQGVVHSHLSSPPRPSRTDVENIGLWEGKPYLIYSLREDRLAGWTIADGSIEPLALS
jgi:proteasome lid subunit RPN8/RPN11